MAKKKTASENGERQLTAGKPAGGLGLSGGKAVNWTLNVIKSMGPWLISQSDKASEAHARNAARLGAVAAGKELMLQEVKLYSDHQAALLEKFRAAKPAARIQIQRDLEEADRRLRHLHVVTQALNYRKEPQMENSSAHPGPKKTQALEASEAHWMDKFNELARAHNEPWRAELLARALAAEASAPGSVPPRLVWFIGTMEEMIFDAFSALIDLSFSIRTSRVVVAHKRFAEIWTTTHARDISLGKLLFVLAETGLIANDATYRFGKGEVYITTYGNLKYSLKCHESMKLKESVFLTEMGDTLASFADPKATPIGAEMFEAWIKSLPESKCTVSKVQEA